MDSELNKTLLTENVHAGRRVKCSLKDGDTPVLWHIKFTGFFKKQL